MNITRTWLVDTTERTGLTFVQAFAGGLVLAGAHVFTLTAVHAAALAGVAAALAVVKAAAATALSGGVSPASLARAPLPDLDADARQVDAECAAEDRAAAARAEAAVVRRVFGRTDSRLGRHVEHDPRSRAYPAAKASALRTVTHRHFGKVLDQGQLGSCTGNATVDALMCAPLHVAGRVLTEADAVKIYSLATELDGIAGAYPPHDTGSSGLAACKAAKQLGLISEYRHAFGLAEVLAALVLQPVIIGIPWTQDMFTPDAHGYVHPTGSVAGGHEIALVGIDVRRKDVTLLNSWGASWGVNGRARLSWDDLGTLLDHQGDCTVPIA